MCDSWTQVRLCGPPLSQPTSEILLVHTGKLPEEMDGWMDEWMCKHLKPEEDFLPGRYGPTYTQCIVI